MADIIWTMIEENSVHVIRLVHTYFGGRREIWLDNQLVAQERMLIDYGSRHFVKVNEHEYELSIVTNGIKFSYFLLQDGLPVPTDQDRARGITSQDLLHSRHLRDVSFWHNLGQALNFSYIPNRDAVWAWRHRLIGLVQGFLVVVQKGRLPNTYREGWSIIIRHSPPLSTDSGEQIWSDNRIAQLLGNLKKSKDAFEHNPDYTWLFLPRKKKETPVELATRVKIFLAVVALYTKPIPEGLCENTTCKQRFIGERQLVSINGMPWFFCEECVGEIPEYGKQAEKAYQSAPNNLLPGFIVGIGIAILGAMIWAAAAILLDLIAAIISAGVLVWIVRGMDQVGTKRSGRSLLLAVLLTFISVTLGSIAAQFFMFIRLGSPITIETLFYAIETTFQDTSVLRSAYIFTLLGAGSYLWLIRSQQKEYLSQLFKPKVENLLKETSIRRSA